MAIQVENYSFPQPQSKQYTLNKRIARLEARLDQMEDKLAECLNLTVSVDGEITSRADWIERQISDR